MRKSFKNILSLLLTLSMIFSIVGVPVFAEESIEDTGAENVTVTVDDGSGNDSSSDNAMQYVASTLAEESTTEYVATVNDNTNYETLEAALAVANSGDTVTLLTNIEYDELHDCKIPAGVTLDGDNKKITIGNVGNYSTNAAFWSDGSYSVKDLTIELTAASSTAHAFSMANGGSLENVTVLGGFANGVYAEKGVTATDCTFENANWGIYTEATDGITSVTGCTFNSPRATVLRGSETFTGNTVNGDKGLSVITTNATITGNTFTGEKALELYSDATITENVILGSVEVDSGVTSADLSDNYWGGSAPANLPEGVTCTTYYTTVDETNGTLSGLEYVAVDNSVAAIGNIKYDSIDEAFVAANDGDIITLLADAALSQVVNLNGITITIEGSNNLTINDSNDANLLKVYGETTLNISAPVSGEVWLGDGAILKDSNINGNVFVAGNVTFRGDNTVNMLYDFGELKDYYGTEANMMWSVETGGSLTISNTDRYGLGYGDNVTISGNLEDALSARESLAQNDAALFTHGLVAQESSSWNKNSVFTVNNAYVIIGSNKSFGNKSGNYGGNYVFAFENAVLDASRITFYEANSKTDFSFVDSDVKVGTFMTRDTDSTFTLTNTTLLSTTTSNGTDEGNYHAGTLTLTNSSLTYSAPLVMEDGTLTLDADSSLTAPSITGTGKIVIDATGMTVGKVATISADASGFTGTLEVINNDALVASVEDGSIVLSEKPAVAQIGETKYKTLAEAFAAAQNGNTIELLADVADAGTLNLPAGVTLEGNDKTISGNSSVYVNAAGGTIQNVVFKNITNGNKLSAVYATGLSGELTITGCTFSGADWDSIQATPVAGAEIVITDNTFEKGEIEAQRYVHIQSALNVDFSATVTGNKMYEGTKNGPMGCYYFTDADKVKLGGNYIAEAENVCILMNDGENVYEEVLPLMDETLENELTFAAAIKDQYFAKVYESLAEAFAEAQDGDTVTLLADVADIGHVSLTENITIEGNGKSISGLSALHLASTGATISNVVFKDIADPSDTKLTPIYATDWDEGATYTITNCVFDNVEYEAMQITDTDETVNTVDIVITGNVFKNSDTAYRYVHVQLNSTTGGVANMTIQQNKFYTVNNDTAVAAALGLYYVDDTSTIDIEKNYIDNPSAVSVMLMNEDSATYNDASVILPLVEKDLTTEIQFAAVINMANGWQSAFYSTLVEAFAAAQKGDTVKLLTDVTLTEQILIENNDLLSDMTLDGNGNTITDAVSGASTICFGSDGYWPTGVKIKNLTVQAAESNEAPYCAIRLYGGTSSVLTNVKVVGDYTYGINFYGTHGATLDNCQIVSAFTNGQAANPLNLTNNTVITTLIANDGADMNPKIVIDNTSSITTLYADEHTAMVDVNSIGRIGTILESDTKVPMVAEINGVRFSTLALAIKNAQAGDTIKLLDNVTLDTTMVTVPAGKTVTLDLNGKTISTDFTVASGNDMAICVAYGADLTIADNSEGGTGVIDGSGVYGAIKMTNTGDDANNGAAKLTVNGGKLIGNYYAVAGNGSRHDTEITINGGTLTATQETWGYGIFHPQNGTLTVKGGTIEAATGIEMRAGTLNVTGGAIKSTATKLTTLASDSGTTVSGAAIALSQHTTDKAITINVTGGDLSGPYAFYQDRLIKTYKASVNISATIGKTVSVTGKVAAAENGYYISGDAGAGYKLVECKDETVAVIGDTEYDTVSVALAAAQSGDTVVMVNDSDEFMITVPGGVTLDLNGKELTATYVIALNGSAIVDNSDANTGLLKVDTDNITLATDNAQLPVYNGRDGYVFARIEKFLKGRDDAYTDEKNSVKYGFIPYIETSVHEYLKNGSEQSGVKVKVHLAWTANEYAASQDFVYNDDFVREVIGSYSKNKEGVYANIFIVTLSDLWIAEGNEDMTISFEVVSSNVTINTTPEDVIRNN